jgi:hypothetical protein
MQATAATEILFLSSALSRTIICAVYFWPGRRLGKVNEGVDSRGRKGRRICFLHKYSSTMVHMFLIDRTFYISTMVHMFLLDTQ